MAVQFSDVLVKYRSDIVSDPICLSCLTPYVLHLEKPPAKDKKRRDETAGQPIRTAAGCPRARHRDVPRFRIGDLQFPPGY